VPAPHVLHESVEVSVLIRRCVRLALHSLPQLIDLPANQEHCNFADKKLSRSSDRDDRRQYMYYDERDQKYFYISDTGVRKSFADISLLFCTCGVRTTRMCISYTQCTFRLCQLA
jgi:hypothetical protein